MYDKNQYWYKYWTQYVTNQHEVAKKCLREPGVSAIGMEIMKFCPSTVKKE